ncbi:MAG: phosphoribosylglycinamide synthetase C domain-containing protein, partial [Clostridia bacterium]|nr:phosphoribosylglycinamide synthetase C domain-containing protein [Clostridia bacterium]
RGATLEEAIEKAYKSVEKVSFDNAYYRKDIGQKALKAKEK